MRPISLREISAETVRCVTELSVRDDQTQFVASNAVSLAQALFSSEAWYRAIYSGETPVGFVMLYDETLRPDPPDQPRVTLWRFMVDAESQGKGIGCAALRLVIDYVRSRGIFPVLSTSYVPGPGSPKDFYLKSGFRPTGQTEEGEVGLELPLQ